MDELPDNLILFGLGFLLIPGNTPAALSVTAVLTAVIAATLASYTKRRSLTYLLSAAVFLACLLNPVILLFFPVFLYDMVSRNACAAALPMLPLFFSDLPVSRSGLPLWLLTALLAVLLARKTTEKRKLSEERFRIRDSSTELNRMLEEKNRTLIEKQDYEIHLATLKERNRIAREIHDNVGHLLSRSLLLTGALLTVEREGAVHDQLSSLRRTLDSAMDSIRTSVHGLHDDAVDLKHALQEMLAPMRPDFETALDYDMSEPVPNPVQYCLIAVTKEALSNTIRHSGADRVQIRCREHPGFYRLSVEDNGTESPQKPENGLGLSNMKDRVSALGGTMRIHRETGFCIFISIPKTEELTCR